jgi:hypothetical protein
VEVSVLEHAELAETGLFGSRASHAAAGGFGRHSRPTFDAADFVIFVILRDFVMSFRNFVFSWPTRWTVDRVLNR